MPPPDDDFLRRGGVPIPGSAEPERDRPAQTPPAPPVQPQPAPPPATTPADPTRALAAAAGPTAAITPSLAAGTTIGALGAALARPRSCAEAHFGSGESVTRLVCVARRSRWETEAELLGARGG